MLFGIEQRLPGHTSELDIVLHKHCACVIPFQCLICYCEYLVVLFCLSISFSILIVQLRQCID
jgi:hypothetical protein